MPCSISVGAVPSGPVKSSSLVVVLLERDFPAGRQQDGVLEHQAQVRVGLDRRLLDQAARIAGSPRRAGRPCPRRCPGRCAGRRRRTRRRARRGSPARRSSWSSSTAWLARCSRGLSGSSSSCATAGSPSCSASAPGARYRRRCGPRPTRRARRPGTWRSRRARPRRAGPGRRTGTRGRPGRCRPAPRSARSASRPSFSVAATASALAGASAGVMTSALRVRALQAFVGGGAAGGQGEDRCHGRRGDRRCGPAVGGALGGAGDAARVPPGDPGAGGSPAARSRPVVSANRDRACSGRVRGPTGHQGDPAV